MILVDTGPLVALFDPKDPDHKLCHSELKSITDRLYTTEAVITEAFHLLAPGSRGSEGLMKFIVDEYVDIFSLSTDDIKKAFGLMNKYSDCPMDYAAATIIVAAESLQTQKVFTLDLNDFSTYRIKKGHRYYRPSIIG